jgi:hypothetical protein
MPTPLNVMVLESHPGAADRASAALDDAGHAVHRCHDVTGRGFPCLGVSAPGECPLDGRIDVALVVRRGVTPRPTPTEDGVSCALRSGVPVVEHGTDVLDPFDGFVTARATREEDVVPACESAAQSSLDELASTITSSLQPFLVAYDVDPSTISVGLEPVDESLHIHIGSGDLPAQVRGLLAVKAVDACRSATRDRKSVEVDFSGA